MSPCLFDSFDPSLKMSINKKRLKNVWTDCWATLRCIVVKGSQRNRYAALLGFYPIYFLLEYPIVFQTRVDKKQKN